MVNRLPGMADRKDKHLFRVRVPAIPRQIGRIATASTEFTHPVFHSATHHGMPRQDADRIAETLGYRQRPFRIARRNELEDPFEIRDGSGRQYYGRHALARGRVTFVPRALAARYSNTSSAA